MDAAMPSQQKGSQPGAKESARGTNPNKGRSPIFVILLLSLIPVMFGSALVIRYVTRGPRVVRNEVGPTTVAPTNAAVAIPITATPLPWSPPTSSESNITQHHVIVPDVAETTVAETTVAETTVAETTVAETTVAETTVAETTVAETTVAETTVAETHDAEVDLTVPYKPKPGNAVHTGDLPGDITPEGYEVTITLNGTSLADDAMQVTGKAEVSYKVVKATSELVLKALPNTIKNVKLALLEAAPTDEESKGQNITTLSSSNAFLIATLEKPLTLNKLYTLVVEYDYDKAAQEGPIKLAAELTKMVLKKGQAHSLFPCSEKEGWNVPINLTLETPADLVAVSNAPLTADPTEDGSFTIHKFEPTKAMPPDMLAWNVFPKTMKHTAAVPNKLNIYMKQENTDLTGAAKKAFEFLEKFFQKAGGEHIPKIDMVFAPASEAQESLGIIVLDETLKQEKICAKIARQWTHVLMSQPNDTTWLGSAGITYLCQLAVTEESVLPATILKQVKECTNATPDTDTMDLLAFRMVHIILGDAATQTAIQAHVTAHIFKATTSEKEMAAFSPITGENIARWRTEEFKTKKLDRHLGTPKKITWNEPTNDTTPFAKDATTSSVAARAPAPVAVAWLNTTHADFEVTAEDTKPLYVNPSVMACYGIHLNSEWWALIGKDMETTPPDAINAWYLLGEAGKQVPTIQRSEDFSGFVWMWAALKSGDIDLWDEHVKKFVEVERVFYSMLDTQTDETKYEARIKAVIEARVKAIKASEITAENAQKAPVLLANLACEIGMEECIALVPDTVTARGLDNAFDSAPLAPEAVACSFGSTVMHEAEFDAKMPLTPGSEPSWSVRLAFCGCIPSQNENLTDKVNEQYRLALEQNWTDAEAASIRVPYGLRKLALDTLAPAATLSTEVAVYQKFLKSAAILKLVRTTEELGKLQTEATTKGGVPDTELKALNASVVPVNAPLQEWINYSPPTP
ncbi:uncharacterized protein LOC142572837 isoform X2 [Dermacentor variabilis]|uniref:uncharacterized protein LOC142572837 isoform X2 n=1 Tax=Dermacentor variabilis TaxID=34621 RepID=UPI003F5C1F69